MTRGAKRKTRGPGRRLLEIGKDLLIAALVLVNLTLAIMCLPSKTLTQTKWLAGALRPFAGLFGLNEAELTYTAPATGSTIVGAAQPLIITLSTEAGRQSAQYDFAALDELYGQYGSLLAQALESAETPQTCTRTEFYAALRGTGAAFCFPGAISPSVLGAWLNVRAPEGGQAQWYVLAQEEDGVTLYLAGEQFSAAKTALPAQSLTAQLETAVPDGSFFAFEAGQEPYAALDGLSLISAQSAQVSTGQSANPCDARFISALAAQIGINPYGDARFVDNDGTTSFTETNLSLRVSAQGQILLQVLQADPRFQSASLDERDRIEAARSLLSSLTGDDYGDARVYLQSYTADGTQAVCSFGYYLSSRSTCSRRRCCLPRRPRPVCRGAGRSGCCMRKTRAVSWPSAGKQTEEATDMSVSRMKNLIILVLSICAACLLAVAVPNRLSQTHEQRRMLAELKTLYESYGLRIELDELPRSPTLYSVELSESGAQTAAQALLGQKAAQPDGGDRFESEYTSELGTLTLTRTGGFSAVLTGGAHVRNYEKSAAKLLHSMGFQFQQLSRRQTEAGVTLEAEQTLLGVPVFGSGLTLSYADGQLQRVEGTFYTGSEAITRVSEQESISGADALARLLAGRDALGWVGSAVTELTLGYLPSENAGTGMRFVPVWRIETDAGSFYVNGITREITPL